MRTRTRLDLKAKTSQFCPRAVVEDERSPQGLQVLKDFMPGVNNDNITDLECLDETSKQAEESRRRKSPCIFTVVLDNISIQLLITITTVLSQLQQMITTVPSLLQQPPHEPNRQNIQQHINLIHKNTYIRPIFQLTIILTTAVMK